LTTGFSKASVSIDKTKNNDKGDYKQVLNEWHDQWGRALPTTHQLLQQLRNQRHGGDLFKRKLVVYVVSTLIKGQQSLKVNHIVLKSSVNVKEVKDFN